ncbi:MAG: protein-L-isoaspartate(D-aspartate) O-methyltransferase [Nitrospirota bacterium]|jgi:protein-L-isoaspartate(D-aspartate) O-methyltransferase
MRHFLLAVLLVLTVSPAACAEDTYDKERRRMVAEDIRGRGVESEKVVEAMGDVPRELFVPSKYRDSAYADNPLPIGEGQTISQPYVVALMTEALELRPSDRVLEIGTGSGYQAAVLAEIAGEVYTVEIRETLARSAEERLKKLGYRNVRVKYADGYFGWPEHAPFDAIIITAAVNHIPPPLIKQLREGGRLILPLGRTTFYQTLTLATKLEGGEMRLLQMSPVRFVPMVGEAQKGEN